MTNPARALPAERGLPLLSSWLRRVLEVDPRARALTFEETDHSWSYFAESVTDLDTLLREHPAARRVGIVLRNRPGHLAAVLATIATGRQIVTLSPHVGDAGLAEDVEALRPDVLVADEQDWAREPVLRAAERIAAISLVVSGEHRLRAHPAPWRPAPAGLPTEDVAVLMMTSGTTGKPKRVALTYTHLTSAFTSAGTLLGEDGEPRLRKGTVILWSALTHISGLYFAISNAVEGRTVALMERFEVHAWARLVVTHRPRVLRLPPTAIRMVLQADVPPEVFSGVRALGSGTAPLPPELGEQFEARYGIPVLATYGATEFAGAIAGWTLADHQEWGKSKRGSVGRPHHGIELRVIDKDTGAVLPAGSTGLLEARGPQLPAADDAWVRTTDLASQDEDGFLFIHGRADEAINRGGFKIPPSVIEDALRAHPAVTDAAAVGLPDERLGEVPAVAVTVGAETTEQELLDHLAARLTRYQMPVALRIVDQLPRTPSMKVGRPQVRDLFAARVDAPKVIPASRLPETTAG
ncbi:hypothetical protein Amsp01_049390 [Amycolatopsis sp. NBRC 101858]|uniref:class I adenylate-forming enzyme family protein n=1 Tax=Amycolatopsis sp. NBRC 101858 TaxID=3032200 RepID=UPI0024A412C6|nr:class I adenylate-forming enzyme family protein [Amycolatopsis sp. NBRC 101858]GLY38915.1 hypothetical protein Amsp01_049390 [Amycolatopsis sp. NBRC 101858]